MDGARTRCLQTHFSETRSMKKFLLATVGVAALGATASVNAADLGARPYYNKAPAYAAPIYNWTGFYIGGHVGGAFSSSNNFSRLVLSDSNARLIGRLQAGRDWQVAANWPIRLRRPESLLRHHPLQTT